MPITEETQRELSQAGICGTERIYHLSGNHWEDEDGRHRRIYVSADSGRRTYMVEKYANNHVSCYEGHWMFGSGRDPERAARHAELFEVLWEHIVLI